MAEGDRFEAMVKPLRGLSVPHESSDSHGPFVAATSQSICWRAAALAKPHHCYHKRPWEA